VTLDLAICLAKLVKLVTAMCDPVLGQTWSGVTLYLAMRDPVLGQTWSGATLYLAMTNLAMCDPGRARGQQ